MERMMMVWLVLVLEWSALLLILCDQDNSQNSYQNRLVQDCALGNLFCLQSLSYSHVKENYTNIFYFIDNPPVQSICIMISPISRHLLHDTQKMNQNFLSYDFNELYCEDTFSEEVTSPSYHYIRFPFALPEGLYLITFYASSRSQTSSQINNNNLKEQLHYIYCLPSELAIQIPFHLRLLSPPFGMILSKKMQYYFHPNYQQISQYEGTIMTVEGIFNNFLPNRADIIASETEIEPGSWFITLVPIEKADFIYSLQYQMTLSSSLLEESFTSYILSEKKYQQKFQFAENTEYYIPYERIRYGYPYYHYTEFILSNQEIQYQRYFASEILQQYTNRPKELSLQLIQQKLSWKQKLQLIFEDRNYYRIHRMEEKSFMKFEGETTNEQSSQKKKKKSSKGRPIHVCITSANAMDGQKRIWLQQAEYLNPQKYSFHWIMSLSMGETVANLTNKFNQGDKSSSVFASLQQLIHGKNHTNIFLADSGYNFHTIPANELEEIPSGETISAAMMWQQNKTKIYEYLHQRYEIAEGRLDDITPGWCNRFYQVMKKILIDNHCHMMIYGNSRGFTTDVFITDVTHSLGIPSVTELLNLYLDDRIIPDIVVAPSHHSLHHDTIQKPIIFNQLEYRYHYPPLQVVIQPSVNFAMFNNDPYQLLPPMKRAKSCAKRNSDYQFPYELVKDRDVFIKHYPCVLIGFVGRLSNEKNPGLFVQMAFHLLQKYPLVRFRFIGNGSIKESLELLTKRLNIDYAVDFIGWIPTDELPKYLSDLDIVVNPSLRGWSETFCISNIEIMSMKIPIVTFAVGGIGEYVTAPDSWKRKQQEFMKGDNVRSKKRSASVSPASWLAIEEEDEENADEDEAEDETEEDTGDDGSDEDNNNQKEEKTEEMIPSFEVVNNAVIFNTADPRQMSEALFYLITNPSIAKSIGEVGRQSIATYFTIERQMQQYDHLYDSIYESLWAAL